MNTPNSTGWPQRLKQGLGQRVAHFRPRLLDTLPGYDRTRFARDLGAGVTVGVVALPLAMAFAVASGLKPEAGLWTAIVGGLVIAALGGTNVQIGGPAGAFIVIVYDIVQRYGVPNLLIATACAGVILLLMGWLRLGSLVRHVPVGIVVGFTNGIAVLVGVSQLRDLLGLTVPRMPADFFSQLAVLSQHLHTINVHALGLGLACLAGLVLWPRLWSGQLALFSRLPPRLRHMASRTPGPMVALVSLSLLAWALSLPVDTIGTRFGSIPQGLPRFEWPNFSWETVRLLVVPTFTIALLGAVESLLCARMADQALGQMATAAAPAAPGPRRHDPNQELMAQGVANLVLPFVGGMPATGTIARTVTNIRAGATTPVAGIVHALTLMAIVLAAAPLALHVPLSVLAGILVFVAWNMGDWHEFARMRRFSTHYRLVMLSTFALTIVFDLTVGIQVGLVLACVLYVRRMAVLFRAELLRPDSQTLQVRLEGSLFFGAVARLEALLAAVETAPFGATVQVEAAGLVYLDTTGLDALAQLHDAARLRGLAWQVSGLHGQPLSLMERSEAACRFSTAAPGPKGAPSG